MSDFVWTKGEPTGCGLCPWEQLYPDADVAQRGFATHRHVKHGETDPSTPVPITSGEWEERATAAVKILAARDEDFAMYEIHDLGVGEPPNPQYDWGRFSTRIHSKGIAHPVAYDLSKRPGTNRSSVRKWSGNIRRCEKHGDGALEGRTA